MKLYNTLTRQKEDLKTLQEGVVKLYTCGLTVYGHPHIGNWVGYIYWDVLVRALQAEGYSIDRVQNITDVGHLVSDDDDGEDKMEKGARAEGITAWDVAKKYIEVAEKEAYKDLGLQKPKLVKATECIDEQIEFVRELEEKGYTYVISGEGVYFDTSKLSDYGKLARLDIDGLRDGARVAVEGRKHSTDFAVWKLSPEGSTRDMEWESPWGMGFPGWHLECSVIARENLGDQIDIHAGGIDHIPVHHTNEIAQTETLTGKQFSSMWVHNNHLKVDGGKMAKSLGNVYTLEDISAKGYSLDAFKLMILSKGYRTEGNFTWEILEAAQNRLNNWRIQTDLIWQTEQAGAENYSKEILDALLDDLDTVKALTLVDAHLDTAAQNKKAPSKEVIGTVQDLLGITLLRGDVSSDQNELLTSRLSAKKNNDWSKSDKLREELKVRGILVRDEAAGQYWSRA